jgi:FlaA1/EpsC-like NDP-sugar epimerase
LLRICFALISTEEALNPTYVIGARKRAGELLVSPLAAEHPGTRIMAVRLGNVLGSNGSVTRRGSPKAAR